MAQILAQVLRNDRVESIHRGYIAVVDADGNQVATLGDMGFCTYMRSVAKPFQFMPVLSDDLDKHFGFTGKELAIMIASHNGEDFHVKAVEHILGKLHLPAEQLQCGFHPPMDEASAQKHLLNHEPASPIFNNCSGKHAGMLAQCQYHGWDLGSYLDPDHPVQARIKQTIARFSGLNDDEVGVGVDGCSAPVFFLPLIKMALMYARLAKGEMDRSAEVFDLMVNNPEMIAGRNRFDTDFMKLMGGGMVSKVGAEGLRCVGVRGERSLGIALKVEDGSKRATPGIVLEVLKQLDLIGKDEIEELSEQYSPRLLNHAGREVGAILPKFELERN